MSTLRLLIVLMLFLAAPALSALPPMTPSMLQAQADAVVVGRTRAVFSRTVETPAGVDRQFLAEFHVERVEKGEGIEAGWLVYPHFWQPDRRPQGWAGPQGQDEVLPLDVPVRLFLKRTDQGGWRLLEPNGWTRI